MEEEHYEPPVAPAQDEVETVVGPSVHVEGDFASEGNIIVKGVVSGSVKTSQLLHAEEGSKIMANVRAGYAVVSGHVKGNIKVDESLELTNTAQILGDITCASLAVEPGALIYGKVMMAGIDSQEKGKRKSSRSKKSVEAYTPVEEDAETEAE